MTLIIKVVQNFIKVNPHASFHVGTLSSLTVREISFEITNSAAAVHYRRTDPTVNGVNLSIFVIAWTSMKDPWSITII